VSVVAFVALGSNLGDRDGYLAHAREGLGRLQGTAVVGVSQVEETEPLGARDQPSYLNQMVAIETSLTPRELLEACLAIERGAGRVRADRWASRTLDLDIVRYGDLVLHEPDLIIPHPGLAERPFWQRELAELLPLGSLGRNS
jgi:2-amino-4-hydroxy-6-hydroxymethyldihydropteridine diphosphokinase